MTLRVELEEPDRLRPLGERLSGVIRPKELRPFRSRSTKTMMLDLNKSYIVVFRILQFYSGTTSKLCLR